MATTTRTTRGVLGAAMREVAMVFGALALGAMSGCTSGGEWAHHYQPEVLGRVEGTGPVLGAQDAVEVREVAWDRMEAALNVERRAGSGDVHPRDWSDETRAAERMELLRELQVPDSTTAMILGRATFTSTEVATKDELIEKARKVGANRVIVSTRPLGQREVIRDEPVTTTSTGTRWSDRRGRDGRSRYESYSETSTTYVPIVVDAELVQYAAYFLRVK